MPSGAYLAWGGGMSWCTGLAGDTCAQTPVVEAGGWRCTTRDCSPCRGSGDDLGCGILKSLWRTRSAGEVARYTEVSPPRHHLQ